MRKNSKNHVYARAGLVVDDYSQLLPMVLYGVSHLSRPILLHSCDAGLNQVKKRPFPSLACIQHTHKLTQTHSIRAPTSWDGNRSREKTHPKSCGRHGSTRISLSKHINICIFISIYCKLQIYVIYEYVNMMFAYFCNFWVVQPPVDHVFFSRRNELAQVGLLLLHPERYHCPGSLAFQRSWLTPIAIDSYCLW